ncbi:MAG: ABC transporter substrate-binding protein [Limnochordia bacterium]|jgi:peptide/nickel transport system substrate-binding protein
MNRDFRKSVLAVSIILILGLLMSGVGFAATKLTDVGTPRDETLIVELGGGRITNPTQMNPYLPGTATTHGFHQLNISNLWEINTTTGEQFPAVAAEPAEALNEELTAWRIRLREGLYWSDGVEFTAEDVAFTIEMILSTKELPYNGVLSGLVKDYTVVDKYTIDIETFKPEPRIQRKLGAYIWGTDFRIVPKHIWHDKDPRTFENFPAVGLGPYVLKEYDPQGYWFLWERREDWERSDVGMIFGKPAPKYVLFRYFGPEEKRVMAAIQHEIDVALDMSSDSWEILSRQNPYARAWYESFPYANMDDPAQRGIYFSTTQPPFDQKEVRWALALAVDIVEVSLATYGGMLRVSPLHVPPVAALMNAYHKPMVSWLKEFELSDGYQPFSTEYAARISEIFRAQGVEDIPTTMEEQQDIFGVGWWKYDPEKAGEMLRELGFSQDNNGRWRLPSGEIWQVTINAPSGFEPLAQRLAFAVAEQWKEFGIDAIVRQMDAASFASDYVRGTYQAGSYWSMSLGLGPDVYDVMETWHKKYAIPVGDNAAANHVRYQNDKISDILDQLSGLQSDDPQIPELVQEMLKEFVEEMPYIPMFGTSKFVPVDTYYWEGFPSADNHYEGPWWWWSVFKYMLPQLQPTNR